MRMKPTQRSVICRQKSCHRKRYLYCKMFQSMFIFHIKIMVVTVFNLQVSLQHQCRTSRTRKKIITTPGQRCHLIEFTSISLEALTTILKQSLIKLADQARPSIKSVCLCYTYSTNHNSYTTPNVSSNSTSNSHSLMNIKRLDTFASSRPLFLSKHF